MRGGTLFARPSSSRPFPESPEVAEKMAHERWAKRMDDAVASAWLRGLRSQGRPEKGTGAQRLLAKAPRKTQSLGNLDRTIVAGADR